MNPLSKINLTLRLFAPPNNVIGDENFQLNLVWLSAKQMRPTCQATRQSAKSRSRIQELAISQRDTLNCYFKPTSGIFVLSMARRHFGIHILWLEWFLCSHFLKTLAASNQTRNSINLESGRNVGANFDPGWQARLSQPSLQCFCRKQFPS